MGDLRFSIGGFFFLVGVILTVAGFAANYHAPLESADVDLYCGAGMLIFGVIMLWLALRKRGRNAG
jgi:hypothetical protein